MIRHRRYIEIIFWLFFEIGYTKTLHATNSSCPKNTVSITATNQSTSKNASIKPLKNSSILTTSHNNLLRYNADVPRRYGGRKDLRTDARDLVQGVVKNDNYRAYHYTSPASSPTRAHSGISMQTEALSSSSLHQKAQHQLMNVSPVPPTTSSSWQSINGLSGKYNTNIEINVVVKSDLITLIFCVLFCIISF